jgi:hypothetical protein
MAPTAPHVAQATVQIRLVVDLDHFDAQIAAIRDALAGMSAEVVTDEPTEPEAPAVPVPEVHYLRDRDGDVWTVTPDGAASWTHHRDGRIRDAAYTAFRNLPGGIPRHLRPANHPDRLTDQEVENLA